MVPSPLFVQYRWPALTATPIGAFCPCTMACGLVPSRLASPMVPSPALVQYRWPASTATPNRGILSAARWPGDRCRRGWPRSTVPLTLLAQYRWLASTATPSGDVCPGTMTCGMVPSGWPPRSRRASRDPGVSPVDMAACHRHPGRAVLAGDDGVRAVPSRLAFQIAPRRHSTGSAQYTWLRVDRHPDRGVPAGDDGLRAGAVQVGLIDRPGTAQ